VRVSGLAPEQSLPAWSKVLAVVAHPDDETFGLGGVIDAMARGGAAVHILCFTHGEASTLNETNADLHQTRIEELKQAGAELGVASVTLLGYPDAGLAAVPAAELAQSVAALIAEHQPDGLLVFDDNGITGHPDHQAATRAATAAQAVTPAQAATAAQAVTPAQAADPALPVLAWALPTAVADQLRSETGQPFAGREPADIDLRVRVDRTTQRRAALMHATQISPGAPLWRRLDLLGDHEHLRWLS